MNQRIVKLSPLLFGSGFCSLAYQLVWMRELRLIFGSSTLAIAAVLAIFMGGIGLGSLVLAEKAEKSEEPLLLYAYFELVISCSAMLSPVFLAVAENLYLKMGGAQSLGSWPATLIRLFFSALVLGVPTFFMGGTMPAITRSIQRKVDLGRRDVGLLYGLNTSGAVVGVLLVTFFMFESLGSTNSLRLTSLLNFLVAIAAFVLARQIRMPRELVQRSTDDDKKDSIIAPRSSQKHIPVWLVFTAAFVSGFCFFFMELVWYRMLAPLLGGTTYTMGIVLGVILVGLALGGLGFGMRRYTVITNLRIFALVCALEALFLVGPFAMGDYLAFLAALFRPIGSFGMYGYVIGWVVISAITVLPTAIMAGYQFPLLIGLKGVGFERIAEDTGKIYAWNTLGAVTGSLLGGIVLLPLLGCIISWQFNVLLLSILAVTALSFSVRYEGRSLFLIVPAGVVAVTFCLLSVSGPSAAWRHTPIGAGRVNLATNSFNKIVAWANENRRSILWEKDGRESSLAMNVTDGVSIVINGKSDGNVKSDIGTQIMGPLISAVLHPAPRQALVLGLGTGCSSGWLAAIDSIIRVDSVEIEPAIVEIVKKCAPMNRDVLANQKVNLIIGDAREVLRTSREKYDLIFSEPSNPYRAGIASLYTKEFYQAVAERLEGGGYFTQWVQGYEIDSRTVKTIYATLGAVFPVVETWETKLNDLVFVCSTAETDYSVSRLRERVATEPFRSGLLYSWGVVDLEGFLSHYVARSSLAAEVATEGRLLGLINTDDRMLVEFGFARNLGKEQLFSNMDIHVQARRRGEDYPALKDGEIDWQKVAINDHMKFPFEGWSIPADIIQHHDKEKFHISGFNFFLNGDTRGVIEAWQQYGRQPEYPFELLVVSEALAEQGYANFVFIDKLRQYWPIMSEAVLARYYWRTGRTEQAFETLEGVLVNLRENPWSQVEAIRHLFVLIVEMAATDKELAEKLYRLLSEPFSVYMLNLERLYTMLAIAKKIDVQYLADTIVRFEPYPVWERSFLEDRLNSYEQTGNPLTNRAAADLEFYERYAPQRFVVSFPSADKEASLKDRAEL